MENNRARIDDHSDSEDELAMPNISITLPLWYLDRYAKLRLGEDRKGTGLVGDDAGKVQPRNYSFGDLGKCGDIAKEMCPMHLDAPCTGYEQCYVSKAVMMHQSVAKYTLMNINPNLDCAEVIMNAMRNNCLQDLEIQCDLVDQCWYTLSESPSLGLWELSALKYYMVARDQNCKEMMILMLTRIRKLFLWIVATNEFLKFDIKELLYILKMHTICVNSEDEIFFSVLRWMEYNWEERKQHAQLLFKEVRFRQMETGLRMSLRTVQENELLAEICDIEQIMKWVDDDDDDMEIKDKTRPEERNWIYIPGVPHHHDIECPRYRPLTYETFKKFLIKVQNVGREFMSQAFYVPQKYWYSYVCCHDLAGKDHKLGKPIRPKMYSTEVLKRYEYKDDLRELTAKEMQAYYKSQTW